MSDYTHHAKQIADGSDVGIDPTFVLTLLPFIQQLMTGCSSVDSRRVEDELGMPTAYGSKKLEMQIRRAERRTGRALTTEERETLAGEIFDYAKSEDISDFRKEVDRDADFDRRMRDAGWGII
tara:strand:- start:8986 stop:9354 length:369 start_codon:yes stop_codon:yes gene_type:complete